MLVTLELFFAVIGEHMCLGAVAILISRFPSTFHFKNISNFFFKAFNASLVCSRNLTLGRVKKSSESTLLQSLWGKQGSQVGYGP